ncbi:MAG TPA: ABC transporter ATP-binding protein [Candidatus Bathyarchaeia archaeon]|nr:ABC transporter ATP-binding protein [Candidatus Bathyarchaeia archaeon]
MISARNVSKRFKDVVAVSDVSLELEKGQYVALLGPNGAGKTTLVEMIEGIQRPDTGEIRILDKSWSSGERHLRRIIGLSLQETTYIDKLTVEETLNLFASFFGLGRDVTPRILDLINLADKRKSYVMNLSHGMRQRLSIGIALINEPEILILDEPTTGLDPVARREIWDILTDLKKKNTSMILTTHYMEEAEHLCDYIIIMDKGSILVQGTLEELLAAHMRREVISFTVDNPEGAGSLSSVEGAIELVWDHKGNRGHLHVKDILGSLPRFLEVVERERLSISQLECRKMNLDDLFISLTGRHLHE